jgi:hypothetical protein
MVQDSQELSFPFEPGHSLLIVGEGGRKDFYGDVATEIFINGAMDLAHAAGAYPFEDFISASENRPRRNGVDR